MIWRQATFLVASYCCSPAKAQKELPKISLLGPRWFRRTLAVAGHALIVRDIVVVVYGLSLGYEVRVVLDLDMSDIRSTAICRIASTMAATTATANCRFTIPAPRIQAATRQPTKRNEEGRLSASADMSVIAPEVRVEYKISSIDRAEGFRKMTYANRKRYR